MTPRSLLLVGALIAALAAAIPASVFDPPASDLLLHGHMVAGAASTLVEHGWAAFQDPWFAEMNWGAPLFHSYPRLAHQTAALLSLATGIDPFACAALLLALVVVALPLATYQGARWLGLTPDQAGLAALVAATLRSADLYGHSPLSYGFDGAGLLPQALGGALAALSIGAWVRASAEGGWVRAGVAAALLSLTVRCHLPAGWVAAVIALLLIVARRPDRATALRFLGIGGGAAALSLGFLLPFLSDLGAVNDSAVEAAGRSYGLARVLGELVRGVYLDGGTSGVWTAAFLVGLWMLVRRRTQPLPRGLLLATGTVLLLFAGRATWGSWMDALPLIGRFHDQRYLLGLHLLAPLVIATGAPGILAQVRTRSAPLADGIALLVVGAALVLAIGAAGTQLRLVQGARAELAAWKPGFAATLAEAEALPPGAAVALVGADVLQGSTTPLTWLRRHQIPTVGRSLHHYSHGYEVANWVFARPEAPPLTAEQAPALHIQALLDPTGALRTVSDTDVDLVRSDVLLRADGASLNGFGIAWWLSGAGQVGQHPTVQIGAGATPDPARYQRIGSGDAPDPAILQGLQARGTLGEIHSASPPVRGAGERFISVRVDQPGAWLRIGQSWHPRWQVLVDGAPRPHLLLLPGNVGVPLAPGEHEVVLAWRVPAWRGVLAALNVLVVLGLLGLGVWAGRKGHGQGAAG